MKAICVIPLLLSLASGQAWGADSNTLYSAKSVATLDCEQFLNAREKGGEAYVLYGGFIGGYVTAYNRYVPATFDISPWQTADTLANMLAHYCEDHRQENFGSAMGKLITILKADRLQAGSEKYLVENGEHSAAIYRETLRDVLQRLLADELYRGTADDDYNQRVTAALEAFQKANGLPVTGVPDQATLFRIYYR